TQAGFAVAKPSRLLVQDSHDSILQDPVSDISEVSTAKAVPAARTALGRARANTQTDSDRNVTEGQAPIAPANGAPRPCPPVEIMEKQKVRFAVLGKASCRTAVRKVRHQ